MLTNIKGCYYFSWFSMSKLSWQRWRHEIFYKYLWEDDVSLWSGLEPGILYLRRWYVQLSDTHRGFCYTILMINISLVQTCRGPFPKNPRMLYLHYYILTIVFDSNADVICSSPKGLGIKTSAPFVNIWNGVIIQLSRPVQYSQVIMDNAIRCTDYFDIV